MRLGCRSFAQGLDVRPYAATTTAILGPMIFNPPSSLTQSQGGREIWKSPLPAGAFWGGANVWGQVSLRRGLDRREDRHDAAGRSSVFGQLTAAYASGSDPDTADTLSVDLSASNGALTSAGPMRSPISPGPSAWSTGPSLTSFSTATLTGPNRYNLTTLHPLRGCSARCRDRLHDAAGYCAARQRHLRLPVPGCSTPASDRLREVPELQSVGPKPRRRCRTASPTRVRLRLVWSTAGNT